jgi:hypothetical protein
MPDDLSTHADLRVSADRDITECVGRGQRFLPIVNGKTATPKQLE